MVIFALPDAMLGRISREVIPRLRSGALVMLLDGAVVLAEELGMREDVSYFFNHPCHRNILGNAPVRGRAALQRRQKKRYPGGKPLGEVMLV